MTVLVGLVHNDGIAVFADRATIDPYRSTGAGTPAPGAPTTKVFAGPVAGADGTGRDVGAVREVGDVVAGIAGAAVVPGLDLLAEIRAVVDTAASPAAAHPAVMDVLTAAAPRLREHHAISAEVTTFEQPVMTVVMLGGRSARSGGSQLVAYGLGDSGTPVFTSLARTVVFAPWSVQVEADAMVLTDDPAIPVADQVGVWGARLRELAPLAISRQHLDISPEWDAAVVPNLGTAQLLQRRPESIRTRVARY